MRVARALSLVIIVVGVWELCSSLLFNYPGASFPFWGRIVIGGAVIIVALGAASSESPRASFWLGVVNAGLGRLLTLAPFLLGYTEAIVTVWNDVLIGMFVALLSLGAALAAAPAESC